MEETVMGVYRLDKLDKAILKVLMEPYRGTDIDSGGAADLKAKDGLEVPDIVIKIMAPAVFGKLEKLRLASDGDSNLMEQYYEKRYEAFHKITKKQFGWE
jgi:hypothetical protein